MSDSLRSRPGGVAGFTLLELLVALSLFGIALLLIYSGLFGAARSWEAGERQISQNEMHRIQLTFVRRLIRETIPLTLYDGRENRVLFQGGRETMRFIAPLPSHRGGDWAYLITLKIGTGEQNQKFLLYYERIREDLDLADAPAEGAPDVILAEAIEGLEFGYFGDPDASGHPDWHAEWTAKDRLPTLVRLELTPVNEESPPLLIAANLPSVPLRGQLHQVLYSARAPVNRTPAGERDAPPAIEE